MLSQSIVTPLSAPGAINPCTLAGVKAQLGITDNAQDAELKRLIRSCALAFAGVHGLRRDYWRRQWRVRTEGIRGVYLLLPVWPVESVSLVAEGADSYGTTIDPAEYEIADPERQMLYRFNGWANSLSCVPGPLRFGRGTSFASGGHVSLDYLVELIAGWLMPDEVTDWSAGASVTAGGYVRSTAPSLYLFQATGPVSLDSSEPTWPTTLGGTVIDSGTIWTASAARRLPDDLEEAALLTVKEWYSGGLEIPSGVSAESIDGASISYDTSVTRFGAPPIPSVATAVLAGYRG